MRLAPTLALALVLVGCAAPAEAPVRERPIGAAPELDCARVDVAATPSSFGSNETATVWATVTNCGRAALTLHASETCTRFGFHPQLLRGEEAWHLWRGTTARREAPRPTDCNVVPTAIRLEPGQAVSDEFYWDGRQERGDCEGCRPIRMPAATYDILVRVNVEEIDAPQIGRANVTLTAS